jgi:hypothetical protein
VTTYDNQSWISILAYVLSNWEKVSQLVSLERVVDGLDANNLIKVITSALETYGGISRSNLHLKLVCFRVDGASVLQDKWQCVTTHIQVKHVPHMHGIHYVAHRTNLGIEDLSDLPLMSHVGKLLVGLYSYFSYSPKRHLKLEKLCELLQVKGGKILNNMKTRWISILPPLWRVLQEYRPLIIKLYGDTLARAAIKGSKKKFNMLADVKRLLSLAVILHLLQSIKNLIVFAQSLAIYVCNFTRALNLYIMDIHDLYSNKVFQSDAFSCFKAIYKVSHEQLRMRWFTDLNDGSEDLVFEGHYGTKAGPI